MSQHHKKEKMQVVRTILFSLVVLMLHFSCVGQKQITGTFERTASIATKGRGVVYFFNDRYDFEKMEFMHLGYKKKYKGTYAINSDTLILNYKPYNLELPKYEIINSQPIEGPLGSNEKKVVEAFLTKIRVVNEEGKPLVGVNLILRNEKKEVIMGFSSNEKGQFPELSINDRYIADLVFSFLGFQDEVIKTEVLYGTITEIVLNLYQGIEYSSFGGTEEYVILDYSLNRIVLSSVENQDRGMIVLDRTTD